MPYVLLIETSPVQHWSTLIRLHQLLASPSSSTFFSHCRSFQYSSVCISANRERTRSKANISSSPVKMLAAAFSLPCTTQRKRLETIKRCLVYLCWINCKSWRKYAINYNWTVEIFPSNMYPEDIMLYLNDQKFHIKRNKFLLSWQQGYH